VEIHSPGPCNIHLLAAMTTPGEYYEYGLIHPFFDWACPPWLNRRIDELDDEGNILVPQGPGMGWDVNYDYIREHLIASK
jgi:L-alanine-DL-glutamate epimerase-like enolase superfamily enzyme